MDTMIMIILILQCMYIIPFNNFNIEDELKSAGRSTVSEATHHYFLQAKVKTIDDKNIITCEVIKEDNFFNEGDIIILKFDRAVKETDNGNLLYEEVNTLYEGDIIRVPYKKKDLNDSKPLYLNSLCIYLEDN